MASFKYHTGSAVHQFLQPDINHDRCLALLRNAKVPSLIAERGLKNAIPLTVFDTGLEGIPEGLDALRGGKVSGSKLAYRLGF